MRSTSAVLGLIVACAGTTAALTVRMPFAGQSPVLARIGVGAGEGRGVKADLDIDSRVATLIAESGGKITAGTYGTSRGGHPLHVLQLGDKFKPALLIVAGLNAQHRVGIETALGVAKKLAEQPGDLLSTHAIYIMPCAYPDGLERERTAVLRRDGSRTVAAVDDDQDGRIDEDGPKDLNGDGVITTMRIPDPPPGYRLEASEMLDPGDARLTKRPDRNKGERGIFAMVVEGEDQDGDGLIAEDGIDGTDMSRNFPYHWPEFGEGAGPYALSEPETRSIAEWVLAHNNLVSVLVFGTHDNLVNVPEPGKMDQTQRIPTGIENEDKWVFDEASRLFKEATGMTGAMAGDNAGSLQGWTYGFLGIYSFSTPVWVRPDLVTKKDTGKPAAPPPAGDAKPPEPVAPPPVQPGAMTDAEIQASIAEFRTASPERRREMMARTLTVPQETQDKLRAAAMAAFADGVPASPASAT
ncbi:MAG: hypothetical protein H7210_14220, partial [Pyrinomonadaceae bacterium]|nr:hypothetical protein [Phycisphaerales bacterium]